MIATERPTLWRVLSYQVSSEASACRSKATIRDFLDCLRTLLEIFTSFAYNTHIPCFAWDEILRENSILKTSNSTIFNLKIWISFNLSGKWKSLCCVHVSYVRSFGPDVSRMLVLNLIKARCGSKPLNLRRFDYKGLNVGVRESLWTYLRTRPCLTPNRILRYNICMPGKRICCVVTSSVRSEAKNAVFLISYNSRRIKNTEATRNCSFLLKG